MRTSICVVTFVILLLIGFLATPGIFRVVNPEYLLALREYGAPLAKLTQDESDTDSKIAKLRSDISNLERTSKEIAATAAAKQAAMKIANAAPGDIASAAIEYGQKANGVSGEIDQATGDMKQLQETRTNIEASRTELRKKLDASAAESTNIYVVARALALGAIGAMMSVLAKYLATPNAHALFEDRASMGRMWASMAMGAIVSVVVVGLFFTGFISIFTNASQTTGETDFWKVTILCLLAGAFSDRLFQAAAGRMDSYLRDGALAPEASADAVGRGGRA